MTELGKNLYNLLQSGEYDISNLYDNDPLFRDVCRVLLSDNLKELDVIGLLVKLCKENNELRRRYYENRIW